MTNPTIQKQPRKAATAKRVELGAGECVVRRALVNLYYQADMIGP